MVRLPKSRTYRSRCRSGSIYLMEKALCSRTVLFAFFYGFCSHFPGETSFLVRQQPLRQRRYMNTARTHSSRAMPT